MALTRVLITVKTYPAISKKYEELVCTAGFRNQPRHSLPEIQQEKNAGTQNRPPA